MNDAAASRQVAFLRKAALLCAGSVGLLGILGLLGWVSDLRFVFSFSPSYIPMAPDTAVAVIALGAILFARALGVLRGPGRPFITVALTLISLYGLLKVLEYVAHMDITYTDVLFPVSQTLGRVPVGRMSPVTGALLCVSAIALLLPLRGKHKGITLSLSGSIGVLVLTTGFAVTTGYLFGTPLLYGGDIIPLAATTALAFTLLGTTVVIVGGADSPFICPFTGASTQALILRTFLPLVASMVVFLGSTHNMLGQLSGIDHGTETALLSLTFLPFSALGIFWAARKTGRVIDRETTAREAAEAALRASEEKYRIIVETANEGIAWIDRDDRVSFVNPKLAGMLGYPPEEIVGKSAAGFLSEDSKRLHTEYLKERRKGVKGSHETRLLRKDGATVDTFASVSPFLDKKGGYLGLVTIFTDVTVLKRAESALRALEEKYRTIVEIANEGIWLLDLDGAVSYVNPRMAEMLGYSPEEMIGRPCFDFLEESLRDEAARRLADQRQGSPARVETRRRRKDGSVVDVVLSAVPLFDQASHYAGVLSIHTDISALKRAEEALKQSEEKYRFLFDAAPVGIGVSDSSGKVLTANNAMLKMLRYRLDDLKAAGVHDTYVDPHDRDVLDRTLRESGRVRDFEVRLKRGDGTSFWALLNVDSSRFEGQDVYLSTTRDFSKRKRAEEAAAANSRELARSNAELQQFAYVTSHDLQEPLRMVVSYLQIIEQRYRGKLDADADEFIGYAVDGGKRMQVLINDLLALARVGSRDKPFAPTNCGLVFRRAIANLKVAIEESGASLTHDPLPTVTADDGQLVQLLQNLIANAIKFRGQHAPHVHVSALREGSHWLFSVRDNGIGIDHKYAERIFVIFQRLHPRHKYPGTGIGLAICKRIVERHGGRIWVESQPDRGSTFYFTLREEETESDDRHDQK